MHVPRPSATQRVLSCPPTPCACARDGLIAGLAAMRFVGTQGPKKDNPYLSHWEPAKPQKEGSGSDNEDNADDDDEVLPASPFSAPAMSAHARCTLRLFVAPPQHVRCRRLSFAPNRRRSRPKSKSSWRIQHGGGSG